MQTFGIYKDSTGHLKDIGKQRKIENAARESQSFDHKVLKYAIRTL
jgi:hypothetical protein